MPNLATAFSMLKQNEPNWCWLASTASIYNFYLSKLAGGFSSITTDEMFKLVSNNSDVKAKYDKGGRDFPHKPKDCLTAVDCLSEPVGYHKLSWAPVVELTESERLSVQHGVRSNDGGLSPAHLKLQQSILMGGKGQRAKILSAMQREILSDRPVLCNYVPVDGGTGHAMVMVGFIGDEIICRDPMLGNDNVRTLKAIDVHTTGSGKKHNLVSVCFTKTPDLEVVKGLKLFFS